MKDNVAKIQYFLYARKSTESEDKQVLSIDSQTNEMKEIAKRNKLDLLTVKTEAHSAKAPGRPIFNELLDEIEKGRAQGVIVWNPDRLSRNSVDTGRLIYLFDLGKLQEIVTPSQVFRNTPNDKFLLNLLCSQAKLENDNKGINVKRGLKTKAERGMYPTGAPLGYMNDKYGEKGNKVIKPDPVRFDLVRKIFNLMLTGTYRPMQILKIANEQWKLTMPSGKRLGRSTLYVLLTRSFYAGAFEYPVGSGNWHRGIHKPMITEEEYDKVQVLLGRKGKPRPKSHIFDFTGMMHCGECNSMITAEEKFKRPKNGNVHHYIYYHCTKRKNPNCSQGCIEAKILKAQIMEAIESLKIPPEFHEFAMRWFRTQNEKEVTSRAAVLSSQRKAYDACVKKLDGLIDMRAASEITESEFSEKKSTLAKEKARLEELLGDTHQRVDRWLETAEEMFTFVEDAIIKFKTGTLETRRRILSTLGSNLVMKERILRIDWENSLLPMPVISKEVQEIHKALEPLDKPIDKKEIERLYARNPVVLRGLDDVRTALMSLDGHSPYAVVGSW